MADHDLRQTRGRSSDARRHRDPRLAFTPEASRAYLAQFHRVGNSVDEQIDRRDRAFVTTARVRGA